MEEIQNKANYYAIIPAIVRYNKELKAHEKLLYGEITALANSKGYCFATNKYFAELYNVSAHTVSQWISSLNKFDFIKVELIKNVNNQIQERRIYLNNTTYVSKNTYPYVQKDTYPMYQNVQYNNINNNITSNNIKAKEKKKTLKNNFKSQNDELEKNLYEIYGEDLKGLYSNL